MKNVLKVCLIAITAAVVLWSCKDDFTDEDLLNKQADLQKDSIQLSIVVYNASTSFTTSSGSNGGRTASTQGLKDLTVSLNVNGVVTSKTTDENGIALFTNMQQGVIGGTVKGTNFTTTNFTVKVAEAKSENGTNESSTYAAALIPVFETSGPNTATVSGKVTCETNLLNNTKENVPNGTKIAFSISPNSTSIYQAYNNESYSNYLAALPNNLGNYVSNTSIEKISFEGNFVATVTNGAYSIQLPVAHHGLEYNYTFGDFTADQTLAVDAFQNELPGSVRDAKTISTSFKMNNSYNSYDEVAIPYVRPIQIDIAAPPAVGTGAAITAKLLPAPVAVSFTVLAGGSGYTASSTTIPVTVVGGDFDNTVAGATAAILNATSNAQGVITGITGTFGNAYRAQATLTIGGGGTGAIVRVNYQSSVAPLYGTGTLSTLTAGGTGYAVAPSAILTGYTYTGQQQSETVSTTISNGTVVNFASPALTYVAAPTITVVPQERTQATASVFVDNGGHFSSVSINSSGGGYSSIAPPAVTLRDLRGGGSGAAVVPVVNLNGTLQTLQVISRGSGYNSLDNANFPSSYTTFTTDGDYVSSDYEDKPLIKLMPGSTKVVNAYYGTGVHSQALYNNND